MLIRQFERRRENWNPPGSNGLYANDANQLRESNRGLEVATRQYQMSPLLRPRDVPQRIEASRGYSQKVMSFGARAPHRP